MNLHQLFHQKRILITGGTGSFGNALVQTLNRDVKGFPIGAIITIFSRDEKKQQDMSLKFPKNNINYIVGDVRDKDKLLSSFKNIDYVFHAAALKHVPVGEKFPDEVLKTNTIGTKNVIEAAEECGVKKVVNFSTDKAAFPINAYGMSKALAEKLVCAHRGDTICVNLRYGNVIGSRGSVIPIFIDKIKKGMSLLVTNSYMTRFLLLLEHAVKLSLLCISNGEAGDLFVIKSPACTVGTIVKALELHYGQKFVIHKMGVRPGEKIHETLLTPDERFKAIDKAIKQEGDITYTVVPSTRSNHLHSFEEHNLEPFTSENTIRYGVENTLYLIRKAGIL